MGESCRALVLIMVALWFSVPLPAQVTGNEDAPMRVVIKFAPEHKPWDLAPRMAEMTGMDLLGVSEPTNSAAFIVPYETDLARGTLAAQNQETLMREFPGAIAEYNYGQFIRMPPELERQPPSAPQGDAAPRTSAPRGRWLLPIVVGIALLVIAAGAVLRRRGR